VDGTLNMKPPIYKAEGTKFHLWCLFGCSNSTIKICLNGLK